MAVTILMKVVQACICWFQAIGAEYGEGFETFRMDGPLKVDVVRILTSCSLQSCDVPCCEIKIDDADFFRII